MHQCSNLTFDFYTTGKAVKVNARQRHRTIVIILVKYSIKVTINPFMIVIILAIHLTIVAYAVS